VIRIAPSALTGLGRGLTIPVASERVRGHDPPGSASAGRLISVRDAARVSCPRYGTRRSGPGLRRAKRRRSLYWRRLRIRCWARSWRARAPWRQSSLPAARWVEPEATRRASARSLSVRTWARLRRRCRARALRSRPASASAASAACRAAAAWRGAWRVAPRGIRT
jgi:hypothetical protein